MRKKKKVKDLGMSLEEAHEKGVYFSCYQILGKYYTLETVHTSPTEIQFGQCPVCGEFSWEEEGEVDIGRCTTCHFVG